MSSSIEAVSSLLGSGGAFGLRFWNRVDPVAPEWVAPTEATSSEPRGGVGWVELEGVHRVMAAGRVEPAPATQEGSEDQLVTSDKGDRDGAEGVHDRGEGCLGGLENLGGVMSAGCGDGAGREAHMTVSD